MEWDGKVEIRTARRLVSSSHNHSFPPSSPLLSSPTVSFFFSFCATLPCSQSPFLLCGRHLTPSTSLPAPFVGHLSTFSFLLSAPPLYYLNSCCGNVHLQTDSRKIENVSQDFVCRLERVEECTPGLYECVSVPPLRSQGLLSCVHFTSEGLYMCRTSVTDVTMATASEDC